MALTRDTILTALSRVIDPATGKDIVAADFVRALTVEGDAVRFVLEVPPEKAPAMEPVRQAAEAAVTALEGVRTVGALLTAHVPTGAAAPNLKIGRHPTRQEGPITPKGVKRIIAVASGKGGVGKSTVSANLAVALAQEGKRVGLLDADIYGPSQPRMMGVSTRPSSPDGKIIEPLIAHGVTMMSIGLMLKGDEAVIWRGPMLMGALQQLLSQVAWGELDVLIVDLPPGTGDVQLTLTTKAKITGALIVSTPQDVALIDARKAVDMFRRVDAPVLGLIENMSQFICPECGHPSHIFGHGGAEAEAKRLGLPFLGALPITLDTRLSGDAGTPVVARNPDSVEAGLFRQLARRLVDGGLV
ncbi:MAG: Mrp/NBP35 family ATP-binding protein [Pseudomonadota bacterium]